MQGVTLAFFEDVWSRNFVNIFASPLLISEYLCGLVITAILTSLVGLVVMLVLATLVFGLSFLSLGLLLVPYLLLLFLFGIALGVIASTLVLRLGPVSEWLVWPIPALLAPFAGVFYPLSALPGLDARRRARAAARLPVREHAGRDRPPPSSIRRSRHRHRARAARPAVGLLALQPRAPQRRAQRLLARYSAESTV